MITYLLFVIGFVLLIKGADLLVDGASALARNFGVSELVIGLTIVSFGTSAPELVVNVVASLQGSPELAVGNIMGSNIANILLILGISAIIYPLAVQTQTTYREIPFELLASLVIFFLANDIIFSNSSESILTLGDGLVLIGYFAIFMYYVFTVAKAGRDTQPRERTMPLGKAILFLVLGIAGVSLGGQWIVDGAVVIASNFGLSEAMIGLTIVAVGTSLPELATSAMAALKRNTDLAIGNIVGSNIFNIFWIFGISSIINPIPVSQTHVPDFILNIFASLLLFASIFVGKRHTIQRSQGVLFLVIYLCYIGFLIYSFK